VARNLHIRADKLVAPRRIADVWAMGAKQMQMRNREEITTMNGKAIRWLTAGVLAAAVMSAAVPRAWASCGCDKPPPPHANVRPFVGFVDQSITLFDDRFVKGERYTVLFQSRDGSQDWGRGRAVRKRDFADGQERAQLRVEVGNVSMGPVQISVYDDHNDPVLTLSDDQFTVIAPPIVLHDFTETLTRDNYQTGVGADGTVYVAVDTTSVSDATTYSGFAVGFPLRFDSRNIAFFNDQGFLMGFLDPKVPGLFSIRAGDSSASTALSYWRHEFRTYKEDHRKRDERRTSDGEWHVDGTPHVDNYQMVVAVSGTLTNGQRPTPGPTAPFQLVVTSEPSSTPNAQ
jgi:hypothetical protein